MEPRENVQYLCCFCGRYTGSPALIEIVMDWTRDQEANAQNAQFFFSHQSCVVDLMVPDARHSIFAED